MTNPKRNLILAYWTHWHLDTLEISRRVGVSEADVYNALAQMREEQREAA